MRFTHTLTAIVTFDNSYFTYTATTATAANGYQITQTFFRAHQHAITGGDLKALPRRAALYSNGEHQFNSEA